MIRLAALSLALLCCVPAHAIGLGNVFGALVGRSGELGNNDSDVDEALTKISAQMNRKTPMSVDERTRLDRVSAEPGKHLTYHYTLLDVRSDQISSTDFRAKVTGPMKDRLCSAPSMRGILKSGVSVGYVYQGMDGKPIGGVNFPAGVCNAST
ncbi:MAG: hypothetical protein JWR22_2781 [Herminiimonas sp.]|nr:hypothetical protein [Herminiimonas sp.]